MTSILGEGGDTPKTDKGTDQLRACAVSGEQGSKNLKYLWWTSHVNGSSVKTPEEHADANGTDIGGNVDGMVSMKKLLAVSIDMAKWGGYEVKKVREEVGNN